MTVALAAAAGTLALTGAQGAVPLAAPASEMTIMSGVSTSAAIPALAVHCRSGKSPAVTVSAHGRAGSKVPFVAFVNNRAVKRGSVTADRNGTYVTQVAVRDNHRSSVKLQLIKHLAVSGVVSPRCAKPAAAAVTSSSAARGSATSFSVNHNKNGSVTRWNPCSGDIHVRVNATKGGAGALADTQAALAALARATGLHLVYDGPTTFVPTTSNATSQPASLVIAWAPPGTGAGRSNYYAAGAVGEGGWQSSGTSRDGGATWTWQIVRGFVVVDPSVSLSSGFGTGTTRGALLLHELGHVVGLNHTGDGSQVMYPALRSSTIGSYGAGDLAGLKAVGATKGCTTAS